MKFDPFSTNLSVIYTLLHRSYEASKKQFWNDTEVLDKLIEKYGKPELEENYRRSLLNIFSVIYYGEIVAMIVSAQLLDMVEHFDAKKVLAAQVIEEAKHATAFQRYLSYLGDIPQPNKYTKKILLDIMNTKLLSLKLLGMQLLVENIAFYLFTAVKDTAKDPILKELLRYVSIDEAKHVGLARKYLPTVFNRTSLPEFLYVLAKQIVWTIWITKAIIELKQDAKNIGIDVYSWFKMGLKDFLEVAYEISEKTKFNKIIPTKETSKYIGDTIAEIFFR